MLKMNSYQPADEKTPHGEKILSVQEHWTRQGTCFSSRGQLLLQLSMPRSGNKLAGWEKIARIAFVVNRDREGGAPGPYPPLEKE